MKNYFSKIWFHALLPVKDRLPLISDEWQAFCAKLVTECFENQNCSVETIAVRNDHIHVLFLCHAQKSPYDLIELTGQESAQIINQSVYKTNVFQWEPGFLLFSVSHSQKNKVAEYILNQIKIHSEKTLAKEIEEFVQLHEL